MTDDSFYHVAGDLLATTSSAIGGALAKLPGTRLELASEVEVEGERYSFAIYPTCTAIEGGEDYLVGGNIWLEEDQARLVVRTLAEALERAGIAFSLEITREGMPDEIVRNERHDRLVPARSARSRGTTGSAVVPRSDAWTLGHGQIVVGKRLYAGTEDEVRAGWLAAAPDQRVLVTLTGKHGEVYDRLRARFVLDFEGIAPLEYVGAPDEGVPYDDVLVERVEGQPAVAPLAEPALARFGAELATIVANVHAAGESIEGIRPELIYVHDGKACFVPRGPTFAAAVPMRSGIRSYCVPYLSPEQFLSNQGGPAADVFALCMSLFFLGTGAHPFGDPDRVAELLGRLSTGSHDPWPGSPAFGRILGQGMAAAAGDRPTAAMLAAELARLGGA